MDGNIVFVPGEPDDQGTYCGPMSQVEIARLRKQGYRVIPSSVYYAREDAYARGIEATRHRDVGQDDADALLRRAEWAFNKRLKPEDLLDANAFSGMRRDELLSTLNTVAETGSVDDCIAAFQQVNALPSLKTPEVEQALANVRSRFLQLS